MCQPEPYINTQHHNKRLRLAANNKAHNEEKKNVKFEKDKYASFAPFTLHKQKVKKDEPLIKKKGYKMKPLSAFLREKERERERN